MASLDYENASDSVLKSAEIFVKILKEIYKESTTTIKLHKISKKIPIQKGIMPVFKKLLSRAGKDS